jgi:hypothetical protein
MIFTKIEIVPLLIFRPKLNATSRQHQSNVIICNTPIKASLFIRQDLSHRSN